MALLFSFVPRVSTLNAQTVRDKDIQKQLEAKFKNAPLIIRHFYSGENLEYNSEGILVSGGEPGAWTINAYFAPEKIKLSKKSIKISGKRIWWTYDDLKNMSKLYRAPDDVKIEISRSPEQGELSGIMASLAAVFLKIDEPLEDFVPPYWKKAIQRGFDAKQARQDKAKQDCGTCAKEQSEEHISPSVIKYQLMPVYTAAARKNRIEGTVILEVIIDENGVAKVTDILQPLGMGLDDSAVNAVEKMWKFAPATRGGIPIPQNAEIEVTFRLY